jgi:hypothetical protein
MCIQWYNKKETNAFIIQSYITIHCTKLKETYKLDKTKSQPCQITEMFQVLLPEAMLSYVYNKEYSRI